MEDVWSVYGPEVTESGRYDFFKFKEVLKQTKEYLRKLNTEKGLEIIRQVLKNPNFDYTDVYYLTMIEIQDPSYEPPSAVPKKPPLRIRFVMSGRQPTKPVLEEEEAAAKKAEKTGRKRPRGSSSDWEFDEEEEKKRAIKKRANEKKANNLVQEKKKKKVNNVVLPEITPDLPDEFKERIRNLGGTEATLVIQKELTATDMSTDHRRLSLPRSKLKDKGFLTGKEKAFLAKRQNGNGVAARLIAENGKEHEIDIRRWNMTKGICNVVKGWNDIVSDHGLCEDLVVQLWSFRVEGNLWFALVKLWKVKKQD